MLTGLSQRESSQEDLGAQGPGLTPLPAGLALPLRTGTNLWTNSRSLNETPILGCHLEPDRSVGHRLSPKAPGQMIAGGDATNISCFPSAPLLLSSGLALQISRLSPSELRLPTQETERGQPNISGAQEPQNDGPLSLLSASPLGKEGSHFRLWSLGLQASVGIWGESLRFLRVGAAGDLRSSGLLF